jgi:D-aminopeptidase
MTQRVEKSWTHAANGRMRARGLGLALTGMPGTHNAITDVAGVEVGFTTLVSGDGALKVGQGPVRTGVTAILPRGRGGLNVPCAAGCHVLNGNGEMSGLAWIEEAGELQTPITITNTHSCGMTRDATIRWMVERGVGMGQDWGLPVAAETYDGDLNDINGFHVTVQHTREALDSAAGGAMALGNVGGGTGMITYDFKGGTATASRRVAIEGVTYTIGVLVQSNFGTREDLTILGVPVGAHIKEGKLRGKEQGSIIAIVAIDAPLQPQQLKRLARRVPLGLARTGTIGGNGSGDIFLAFSTANGDAYGSAKILRTAQFLGFGAMDILFRAVVEATEEAVIDAVITGETMVGRDGNTAIALPHDKLLGLMRQYGRM